METETKPTPERLRADVHHIKEWISKQPHLPKVEDEEWLKSILHHNKYRLEKTKNKLDNYYSLRTKYPEILKNRDPTGADVLQAMASDKIVVADRLTKDGELVIFNTKSPDTSIYDVKNSLKLMFMICDTFFLENTYDEHVHIVLIADCQHLSYMHFLKAVAWLKPMVEIYFSAYSERVKALHVVNGPANLDIVFNTIKGLLPKKIAERFHVYPTTEKVCALVDEDVVTSDFGGKGPSLAHYEEYTLKRLEKHRQWFREQDHVCSNEELRRKTDSKIEDMQGSFRKLQVD